MNSGTRVRTLIPLLISSSCRPGGLHVGRADAPMPAAPRQA